MNLEAKTPPPRLHRPKSPAINYPPMSSPTLVTLVTVRYSAGPELLSTDVQPNIGYSAGPELVEDRFFRRHTPPSGACTDWAVFVASSKVNIKMVMYCCYLFLVYFVSFSFGLKGRVLTEVFLVGPAQRLTLGGRVGWFTPTAFHVSNTSNFSC